ncbi:MAG: RNB domain-containing ribonuclease [Acidobacteria bacterium]|nr:RNB domain-containing ribonuclease [Acidobacteriota bacterium]
MLSDSLLLEKIRRQPKHAAGYKQLVRELGLNGDERRELFVRLEKLADAGQLVRIDAHRYAIAGPAGGKNVVAGTLSLHRDGYGFVGADPSSVARLNSPVSGDIFISPYAVGSAMHGDRVLVEITSIRRDHRAEGRIIRSLARAHPTVVGLFHYAPRHNYVTPIDPKLREAIRIPPGREYPRAEPAATNAESARPKHTSGGGRKQSRHRVIGGEARRPREWNDLENVVVEVEITDWPTATQSARGQVVEILGYQDDFGVDFEIVIRKHHLRHRFPPEVLAEAEAVEPIIAAGEVRTRRDFRQLPVVTIDGETARDFDDAVVVQRMDEGSFQLQVHIADVAHYVRSDSALDEEARLRGTSVYFPDRAVPMLPLELSSDICSLRPQVDRLVLSCLMEIDHRGEVVSYEICPGVIRSVARMTYTSVNAILEGDEGERRRYSHLLEQFSLMNELAAILRRKRERRGSIDFDLPEPVIEFDQLGLMKSIVRSDRNTAHRIIEEFMLAANECVAGYLEAKAVPSLYRIHEKPDAKRVYDFEVIAATFGYSLGIGALPIQRVQFKSDRRSRYGSGRRAPEFEIPEEVQVTPRMYQKLTEKIAGKAEERILSYLMLRSLKQARYSEENLGHFALATKSYTHFTSPIRRYPDLIVQRILKQVLRDGEQKFVSGGDGEHHSPACLRAGGHAPPAAGRGRARQAVAAAPAEGPIPVAELRAIAEDCSQSERRADDAERELMEWKKVKFMQDRLGDDFAGLIISVTKYGLFVELTDLFVEGLVPLATLADDRYAYHENTREIIGQRTGKTYRLGQNVRVLVDRIDPVEKKIQFALLDPEPSRRSRREKGQK